MSNITDPIADLGLSCPDGGSFHICADSTIRFLGCCDVDPCADGTGDCPASHLHTASFDVGQYDMIRAQDCVSSSTTQDLSSAWYTCTGGPFLGCCSSNPCSAGDGCPASDLVAAKLSDNTQNAAVFLGSSSSGTSSSATPTSSSSFATTSAAASDGSNSDGEAPVGKIVGGAVGGVAALILLVAFVFLYVRRRRNQAREEQRAEEHGGEVPASQQQAPWSPKSTSTQPLLLPFHHPFFLHLHLHLHPYSIPPVTLPCRI